MYPAINYDIATARIADLHRQAEHDRLANAASKARGPQHEQRPLRVRGRSATVLARCLDAVLPARPGARPRSA